MMTTDQFSYDPARKLLHADASDLGKDFAIERRFDGDQYGTIKIVGERTTEKFLLVNVDRDAENEIAGWRFTAVNPALEGMMVLIVND